jgi:Haem-degrading
MSYAHFDSDIEASTSSMLVGLMSHLSHERLVHWGGTDQGMAVVVLNPANSGSNRSTLFHVTYGKGDLPRLIENATRKATAAKRVGMDSALLAGPNRHLIQPGDFPHPGAVIRSDVVVGVSGLTGDQDHWVAEMVAGFINLKRQEALDQWRKAHPDARYLEVPAK